MATKTYTNRTGLTSSSEFFLRQDIKKYEERGWKMNGHIRQSIDGRYSCEMIREHRVISQPVTAS